MNGELFVNSDNTTVETCEERFNVYLTTSGLTDTAQKKASFLYQIGSETHVISKTLVKANDSEKYAETIKKIL